MAMAKMKKIIILLLTITMGVFVFYAPIITPEWYFHLSEKNRKLIIEKLSKNCLSADTLGLGVTYDEVFNDKNASHCWGKYFEKCLKNKDNNLTLVIPITCPSY